MALASAMNMSGLDASKPASGFIAGRIYIATDTNKLYVDSGSAWVDSGLGAGGGGGLTELAYNQATSNVSITGTTEATATVVVTASSVTFGSGPVLIEFSAAEVVVSANCVFILHDDTAALSLGYIGQVASGIAVPVSGRRRLTPGAGARVYSIRAWLASGTATVEAGTGGAGLYVPACIRIVG